jgi:3-hydroxy-9,10-secoandrosta-1,3,5(10)-triene-9,17-dione monooxygenase reductase component
MSFLDADSDPHLYRQALGLFASGVTVISGIDDGGPIGFTCQSFYSVSMEPPLVSFSVMTSSTTYPRIRDSGSFAVNVLSHHQHGISSQFATRGSDKWAGVPWTRTPAGNPVIDGALMWFDCDIWEQYRSGDHDIVIGCVKTLSATNQHEMQPLLYFNGQYRQLRGAAET